jgi:hypothetical protein
MAYNPNIPNATDYLDESQPQLKQNFQQLDTSFAIDHYAFSDIAGDTGKHKVITTVSQGTSPTAHPTTAANEPKIYAFKSLGNIPVLDFSRGGSDAVPTPITILQSSAAPISYTSGTHDIFDFSGINYCICKFLYTYQNNNSTNISNCKIEQCFVVYNSTIAVGGLEIRSIFTTTNFVLPVADGSKLQVYAPNNVNQFRWAIEFIRIE